MTAAPVMSVSSGSSQVCRRRSTRSAASAIRTASWRRSTSARRGHGESLLEGAPPAREEQERALRILIAERPVVGGQEVEDRMAALDVDLGPLRDDEDLGGGAVEVQIGRASC